MPLFYPLLAGRWPSNPVAFAKMRAALGVQLAGALEKAHGLTCQVSRSNTHGHARLQHCLRPYVQEGSTERFRTFASCRV
jgi:hypothetical protein